MKDIKQPELPEGGIEMVIGSKWSTVFNAAHMHAHAAAHGEACYAAGVEDERKIQISDHDNNYQHLLDALKERDSLRTELAALKQSLAQPAREPMNAEQRRNQKTDWCPHCGQGWLCADREQAYRVYAQQPAQTAVPEGWKLVPLQPPYTMVECPVFDNWKEPLLYDLRRRIYREMIALAPDPPTLNAAPVREGGVG